MLKRHAHISAGLLDAGFASLASFAMGITAVRLLDTASLGAYALVFGAFNLIAVIPQQLLFTPFEVASVSHPRDRRLVIVRQSMRLGGVLALLASMLLVLWLLVAPPGTPHDTLFALTVTGVACTFLSPVQDHLRRMQHLAGRSAAAAAVSAVHLATALATLGILWFLDVAPWWMPLGSLAVANLVSTTFGMLISVRWLRTALPAAVPDLRGMLRSGTWLLIPGLAAPGSAFLVGVLIVHLAGAAALGYAEAARVVGQPMFVLAMGLSATLGPRSMEAARERSVTGARRISRQFFAITAAAATLYLFLFSLPWEWNPLVLLVPRAFEVAWLVPAVLLATTVNGWLFPLRAELIGARREKSVAWADSLGAAVRVCAGGTAGVIGSFAMPLGYAVLGTIRWILYRRRLQAYYTASRNGPDGPVAKIPAGNRPVAV
jgi:O-antigen/teichoic acid export membrane protein